MADSDVPRDKVKIQYSTSENACRGEATAQGAARAAGPAGCVDDWTDSPASFGDVRAVRAEFANANLAPKASIQMLVPVAAPAGASGTAWNSVAMAGREKGGKRLLPIEPIKVGLETTVDLEVEKAIAERKPAYGVGDEVDFQVTVKNLGSGEATSVRDGARGGGEAGVEGTKVELRDHDGAVVATATTGADGSYSFNRVPSGTATGVKVEDRLPKGLTFVSADRPYDSATGVWDVAATSFSERPSSRLCHGRVGRRNLGAREVRQNFHCRARHRRGRPRQQGGDCSRGSEGRRFDSRQRRRLRRRRGLRNGDREARS